MVVAAARGWRGTTSILSTEGGGFAPDFNGAFSADFTCAVAPTTKPRGSLDPREPFLLTHSLA